MAAMQTQHYPQQQKDGSEGLLSLFSVLYPVIPVKLSLAPVDLDETMSPPPDARGVLLDGINRRAPGANVVIIRSLPVKVRGEWKHTRTPGLPPDAARR